MLTTGPAKKVTIYVMEGQTYHGVACYNAILEYLFFRGISDATVVRGVAGFGTDHKLHTSRLVDLSDQMPIKIEFLESPERVEEVLPKLSEMACDGIIEVQDTTVITPSAPGKKAQPEMPAVKLQSQAKLMRILIGESDKWNGKPLHEALVQALRANEIAGVTVYRGILGYGANRRMHKDSTLNLSHDAPILLTVVDTEEKLRAFFPVLDQMVLQGLVVLSDVDVIKYSHAQPSSEIERAKSSHSGNPGPETRETRK
jgi:PII-like signaling protein